MKVLFQIIGFVVLSWSLGAGQGQLHGEVTVKSTGELVLFCNVVMYKDSVIVAGAQTDFDGRYVIEKLDNGSYILDAFYLGLERKRIPILIENDTIFHNIELVESCYMFGCGGPIVNYNPPLIDLENTTSGQFFDFENREVDKCFILFKKKDLSIKGKIRQYVSDEPMSHVQVVLLKHGKEISRTVCDADGFFELYPVKKGQYDIDFIATGHKLYRECVKLKRGEDVYLYVKLKERESDKLPY